MPSDDTTKATKRQGWWAKVRVTPAITALSGTVLKVTLALAQYASPSQPWAWPKVADLAEQLGVGERKVRWYLERAEQAGTIRRFRRGYSRASHGYDLRPFFLAMGFEEAAGVLPPPIARIGRPVESLPVGNLCRPVEESSARPVESLPVSPNQTIGTDHLETDQTRGTDPESVSHVSGEEDSVTAEARKLAEAWGVTREGFALAIASKPELSPDELLSAVSKWREHCGKRPDKPDASLKGWMKKERGYAEGPIDRPGDADEPKRSAAFGWRQG